MERRYITESGCRTTSVALILNLVASIILVTISIMTCSMIILVTSSGQVVKYEVKTASFEYIIKKCDIISLHVPLNTDTYHLIGKSELKSMKKNAVLINTSRGAVVDEDILVKALKEGWIKAAGIDVFEKINVFDENEKQVDSPLFHLDNVILSPHCGACSDESLVEVKKKAIKEVINVLSGRWPKNCVNNEVNTKYRLVK